MESRAFTEDFSRDSFENLLYSICRAHEAVSYLPLLNGNKRMMSISRLTIASFEFKKIRFFLHAIAINFPLKKINYIGSDPPDDGESLLESIHQGELNNALTPYQYDPYACYDKKIHDKRHTRNPQIRSHGFFDSSCPHLQPLVFYCGEHVSDDSKMVFASPTNSLNDLIHSFQQQTLFGRTLFQESSNCDDDVFVLYA